MPPVQHPYHGLFGPGKGIRAFTGHLRDGHPQPILVNAQDGRPYSLRGRSTRCSSPTTPPAERRAYAAREQARRAKTHSSTSDTSERSISVPPKPRHTHIHRVHPKRESEPDLEHLPHAHRHSTRHHRKASKPVEPPRRPESDTESHWSTNVHVPWTHHHPHHNHHHHHAAQPEHVVFKAPLNCQCHDCLQAAHAGHPRPVETTKEDPMSPKYVYEHHPHSSGTHSVPVDRRVNCSCGYVHVESAREQSSRSTSPEKHRKGPRRHSIEQEEARSHRHRRRRHRRHRHYTTDSSSDTMTDDFYDTSSESDAKTRTDGREKVEHELPTDWQFYDEYCCGHPVIYIVR